MKKVREIMYPNNTKSCNANYYTVGMGGVFEIRPITKNGEMAAIEWFQIIDDNGNVIAEIKGSICNIYYEDYKANEIF